jgi:hypothetical protein
MENNMKHYKSLKHFAKSFNQTDCHKMRFMKRKGGYVFNAIVNNEEVEIIVSFTNKEKELVIFSGSFTHKCIQGIRDIEYTNYKMNSKKEMNANKAVGIDPYLPF